SRLMSMIFSIANDMTSSCCGINRLRTPSSGLADGRRALPLLAAMFHGPVEQCNAAAVNVINRRCRGWKFQSQLADRNKTAARLGVLSPEKNRVLTPGGPGTPNGEPLG